MSETAGVSYSIDAAIAERKPRTPFTVDFDGEVYTLPARPDIRADAALQEGRLAEGFRLLFGDEQWKKLQASPKVLDDEAFLGMYAAYQAHTGEDLGEDEASKPSSKTTAKR